MTVTGIQKRPRRSERNNFIFNLLVVGYYDFRQTKRRRVAVQSIHK